MFEGLLKPELPVYAMTAANAKESSWGTYCGDDSTVGGKSLGTCLGDLFSVNWMQDSDLKAAGETFGTQYLRVKNLTAKSHVMRYGQVEAFENEPIADFQGGGLGSVSSLQAAPAGHALKVDSREAKLHMLYEAFLKRGSADASDRLVREVRERQGVHAMGKAIAGKVLGDSHAATVLAAPLREDFSWTASSASCHELAVRGFSRSCGWTENRLVLSKTLSQLCERTEHNPAPILAALDAVCGAGARVQPPLWT